MSDETPKAKGSVRILKFRTELLSEVRLDDLGPEVPEGERYRVLQVELVKCGTGTNPKDGLSAEDIRIIMLNDKALMEMACLTLIEKHHRERNPLVIPGKVPRGPAS